MRSRRSAPRWLRSPFLSLSYRTGCPWPFACPLHPSCALRLLRSLLGSWVPHALALAKSRNPWRLVFRWTSPRARRSTRPGGLVPTAVIPCEEPWVDPRPLQLPPEKASQVQLVLPWRCEPQHPCWAGSTLTEHTGCSYTRSRVPSRAYALNCLAESSFTILPAETFGESWLRSNQQTATRASRHIGTSRRAGRCCRRGRGKPGCSANGVVSLSSRLARRFFFGGKELLLRLLVNRRSVRLPVATLPAWPSHACGARDRGGQHPQKQQLPFGLRSGQAVSKQLLWSSG